MTREEKNKKAYNDVLECSGGPTMPDDEEYMFFYRGWYPLGAEAAEERKWMEDI